MDVAEAHKKVYDALAHEYEQRVESLRKVTGHGIARLVRHVRTGKKILDVGCGPGLAMHVLGQEGFTVEGIELSPKMAALARRRNPDSRVAVGDFLTLPVRTRYDGVLAFAFIHLFPKVLALKSLRKMYRLLKPGGVLLVGTTESSESSQGWEEKRDYGRKLSRFRKHWTRPEFMEALRRTGFRKLEAYDVKDPYGKVWMDVIVRKPRRSKGRTGSS